MRVAHATDIHWMTPPPLGSIWGKRLLGTLNLYLKGRRHHFTRKVQSDLVESLRAVSADAIFISGDLTAQALHAEFQVARDSLQPLLDVHPSVVIAGNHDVYTRGAAREDRIATYFGRWLHRREAGIAVLDIPGVRMIGLDPNRPRLLSSGEIPLAQLQALPSILESTPATSAILLGLHYPVLDRHGAVYDGHEHGLVNARDFIDTLNRTQRRPSLIVHGHEHHGFHVPLVLADGSHVPIYNPGSSGYAWLPQKDRAACYNVYEFDEGKLVGVERYRYGPDGFVAEPGGPYATGR